jgi:hypothetical protein
VSQTYTYHDAVDVLTDLDLPIQLAEIDGCNEQEHYEWLCNASSDEILDWASWMNIVPTKGGRA